MIEGLVPYPEYRDSGLPWLPKIPASWSVARNGRLFTQRNKTGHSDLPILEVSLRSGVRVRDMKDGGRKQVMADRSKYKQARAGDLAYNTMRMWQGAVGVAPVDGLVSPAYVVATPVPEVDASYLARLFRTSEYLREIDTFSRGIVKDRNRLYWEAFKQIPTPLPPLEEQAAINRFVARVEQVVARALKVKRETIACLEEQSQNIVHEAVTRGSDPRVSLRPSGVPWFGDLPQDWEVVRFKDRVGFREGPGIMAADFRDRGVPLLRISCLSGERASLDGCNYLDPHMVRERWSHFAVRSGDYLLSASGSTGTVALADKSVEGAIPYTGILRLWAKSSKTYMPFVRLFMASRLFLDQIDAAKSGVGIEHFGPTHLKRMAICLPPPERQQALVEIVNQRTAPLTRTIQRVSFQIEALRDYSRALVRTVVTGQLDIREAARRLPDTVPTVDDQDGLDTVSVEDELKSSSERSAIAAEVGA